MSNADRYEDIANRIWPAMKPKPAGPVMDADGWQQLPGGGWRKLPQRHAPNDQRKPAATPAQGLYPTWNP